MASQTAATVRRVGVRIGLRTVVLVYLTLLLVCPLALVLYKTFENGIGPVIDSLTTPSTQHAIQITLVVAFWAVVANTIFGVTAALLLVRHTFHGKRTLNALIHSNGPTTN